MLDDAQREGEPDIYRMLLEGRIDVVTFTSASAVRNFAKVYGAEQAADLLKNTVVAAIGPVTADAARSSASRSRSQPTAYTMPALVDAIAHAREQRRTGSRRRRSPWSSGPGPTCLVPVGRGKIHLWLSPHGLRSR